MESVLFFAGLFCLFVFIGSLLGWVAFFRAKTVAQEVSRARRDIIALSDQLSRYEQLLSVSGYTGNDDLSVAAKSVDNASLDIDIPIDLPSNSVGDNTAVRTEFFQENTVDDRIENNSPTRKNNNDWTRPAPSSPLVENIKANWMIWIGGISIGFAGVFLVKYSIDNGWLGPQARIIMALITGILLHGAAYRLHCNKGQNDVFAALAGGASLILYAAVLAALHLYQLFSPSWAFICLAVISFATMLLALIQGPVLAALGILGAYLVPVFVSTGSHNITAALIYSFIVTCSALLLIRFVTRSWLWIGTLMGAGFWWLISLSSATTDFSRLMYLLALAYAILAIECWDWRLRRSLSGYDGSVGTNSTNVSERFFDIIWRSLFGRHQKISISFIALLVAWTVSLIMVSMQPPLLWILIFFVLFTVWAAANQRVLLPVAWLGFIAICVGLLIQGVNLRHGFAMTTLSMELDKLVITIIVALSMIYGVAAAVIVRSAEYKGYWASLGLLAPLLLIALGYVRVSSIQTDWQWAAIAVGLGALYFNLLYRKKTQLAPTVMVAIIFAGHLAYSLAVVILMQEATLTLALAVQVISLVWLDRYFRLPVLPYLVKAIIALIIFRLTFNPWLLAYPADIHWSLWTYGGSFVSCAIAAYLIRERDDLLLWLKAAATHLLVLTITAETRYQLYDGDIFAHHYSFLEAALNTCIWGALGLVYTLRMRAAQAFAIVYQWASGILLLGALINYIVFLLMIKNPLFHSVDIGATPIVNILLLAYGLPCVIAGLVCYSQTEKIMRQITGLIAVIGLLIFVSLEIRHLWHGELAIWQPMLAGELYTYSMVWLVIAILGSLISVKLQSKDVYRGSMLFLLLVVAKIFLIDTSGLSSLWRVAAFMGLGLALLGLAYFHQKMGAAIRQEVD
jgi:uncharacterized membrane protein